MATVSVAITLDGVRTEILPLCDDCLDAVRFYIADRGGDPDDDRILDVTPWPTL